jgi:glycosyltransferase involved in cell wall biosynthesis
MMRALNKRHEVHFLGLGASEVDAPEGAEHCRTSTFVPHHVPEKGTLRFTLCALKNMASTLPLSLALYRSSELTTAIRQLNESISPDLVVCDFLTPAPSMPAEMMAQSVLFAHNVESLIWERLAANASSKIKSLYLGAQHQRMLNWEGKLSAKFARVITVSEADSAMARQCYGLPNVAGHVPTGVDAQTFAPLRQAEIKPGQFCFLGSMDWLANIDAVQWFLREVWPDLYARHPAWRFKVIGRKPPQSLLAEFDGKLGIQFTGTVEDVRPHLSGCAAAVVPLRIGGGTRLKILELMAAGIPVIASTIGAEGLPLQHEVHFRRADDAAAFMAALEDVHANPEEACAMAQRSHDDVVATNTWDHVAEVFLHLALNTSAQGQSYGNVATRQTLSAQN